MGVGGCAWVSQADNKERGTDRRRPHSPNTIHHTHTHKIPPTYPYPYIYLPPFGAAPRSWPTAGAGAGPPYHRWSSRGTGQGWKWSWSCCCAWSGRARRSWGARRGRTARRRGWGGRGGPRRRGERGPVWLLWLVFVLFWGVRVRGWGVVVGLCILASRVGRTACTQAYQKTNKQTYKYISPRINKHARKHGTRLLEEVALAGHDEGEGLHARGGELEEPRRLALHHVQPPLRDQGAAWFGRGWWGWRVGSCTCIYRVARTRARTYMNRYTQPNPSTIREYGRTLAGRGGAVLGDWKDELRGLAHQLVVADVTVALS